jgi:hypothetical protein
LVLTEVCPRMILLIIEKTGRFASESPENAKVTLLCQSQDWHNMD